MLVALLLCVVRVISQMCLSMSGGKFGFRWYLLPQEVGSGWGSFTSWVGKVRNEACVLMRQQLVQTHVTHRRRRNWVARWAR